MPPRRIDADYAKRLVNEFIPEGGQALLNNIKAQALKGRTEIYFAEEMSEEMERFLINRGFEIEFLIAKKEAVIKW
jgi:hypothetical protein